MTIQWFPGHMAKARRQAIEKIKLIDVVIELVDARIPFSSRNPMIDEIVGNKPRLLVLNKADMADPVKTEAWLSYFKEKGCHVLAINSHDQRAMKHIIHACEVLLAEKRERMRSRGVINLRAIRALILGIPNVGKSTLINRLAKKQIAKTGDRPGVTTAQQWIKVGKEMDLLDTPGILWPKFEDQDVGFRLAVTGAIKDTLLHFQDIALYALTYIQDAYPALLMNRYGLTEIKADPVEVLEDIGKKRGCMGSGGFLDYDKAAELLLREIRTEKLGKMTFEMPKDHGKESDTAISVDQE